jgi:hypothetical protein
MSRWWSYDAGRGFFPAVVWMRGIVSVVFALIVLSACGDTGLPPVATDQIRARFPPGGVVDVIEIDAVDRLPLRKAELVAPDGQATPASYLNVIPSPDITLNREFASSPFAGNNFGYGNVTPNLAPPGFAGAPQQRVAILAMVSTASIPLPDPVEYRRDWRGYRIRLDFGDPPGDVETRELAAPEPPPGG